MTSTFKTRQFQVENTTYCTGAGGPTISSNLEKKLNFLLIALYYPIKSQIYKYKRKDKNKWQTIN